MTKLLFILSAIVMVVSSYLSYENGRTLTALRNSRISQDRQTKTELEQVTALTEDITKVANDVAEVGKDVDVQNEKLKSAKLKIAQLDGDSKQIEGEMKDKTAKMAELNAKLVKLPQGFNPQTITEDLNKIKAEIAELQNETTKKKEEVAAAEKKNGETQKQLDDVAAKIETRKKSFERNSMSFRVVAVNNDWGFVIIDGGEKEGITPDTKLLIIRGTQTVGKLTILAVQGSKTIANVMTETLAPGMTPTPGDKVILENLYQ